MRLAYARCAPSVRPVCAGVWRRWLSALQFGVLKLAGGVAEWVLRYSWFFLTILDHSSLWQRLTTAYGSSVLRQRQRPSTTAASYDDGSVVRRRQATAAARQRRLPLDQGDSGLCRRQTTAHRTRTTARPISAEDDGSGRHRRRRHRRQHQSRPRIETTINRRPG